MLQWAAKERLWSLLASVSALNLTCLLKVTSSLAFGKTWNLSQVNKFLDPAMLSFSFELFGFFVLTHRAVGRSENPGVPVLFGGHNLPPPPIVT